MAADPGRTLNPLSEQMGQGRSAPMSTGGCSKAQRCHGQGAHSRGQEQQEQNRAPKKFDGQCEELLTGHVYDYIDP